VVTANALSGVRASPQNTMSLFTRVFRRESPKERQARKRLEEYFRNTRNERQELENTCWTFLTSFYFPKGGEAVRERLLKREPLNEWTTLFMHHLQVVVRESTGDKEFARTASPNMLVRGTFF
jgi:hypothetical protein